MNFCSACGTQLSAGTTTCPNCAPVRAAAAPPAAQVFQAPISQADAAGFIGSLFDLSFTTFITSKLIKVLYVLGIGLAAVWALAMVVTGVTQGGVGLFMAVLAPVGFLAGVIYMRVLMEVIMVVFRGSEHLAEIARQGRRPGY